MDVSLNLARQSAACMEIETVSRQCGTAGTKGELRDVIADTASRYSPFDLQAIGAGIKRGRPLSLAVSRIAPTVLGRADRRLIPHMPAPSAEGGLSEDDGSDCRPERCHAFWEMGPDVSLLGDERLSERASRSDASFAIPISSEEACNGPATSNEFPLPMKLQTPVFIVGHGVYLRRSAEGWRPGRGRTKGALPLPGITVIRVRTPSESMAPAEDPESMVHIPAGTVAGEGAV